MNKDMVIIKTVAFSIFIWWDFKNSNPLLVGTSFDILIKTLEPNQISLFKISLLISKSEILKWNSKGDFKKLD